MKKDYKELGILIIREKFMKIVGFLFGDKMINSMLYKLKLKKGFPNFKNPQNFSEKLLFLKMYYNNPLMYTCVDKYNVRKYVELCGYKDILNEVYAVYSSVDEIDFNDLPETCFVQMNHMSRFNYILNKNDYKQLEHIKKIFKRLFKYNHYWILRERAYKYVNPKIICSKYLIEDGVDGLTDYKFYCFDGVPKYFMVSYGEFDHNTKNVKYDMDWNCIDDLFKKNPNLDPKTIKKPKNFDYMVEIATKLSHGFPHVRIDLYNISGKVIFGEMTFFSSGGFIKVHSDKMNKKIGSWIDLKKVEVDLSKKIKE